MSVLIDTTVLGEILNPVAEGSRWARRWLVYEPISVSAISVFELAFGFQQAAWQTQRLLRNSEAAQWRSRYEQFTDFIRQESFEVCSYDLNAALVASYLYARAPTPPASSWQRTRSRKKTKTAVRRSWLLDVKIAAIAVSRGYRALTANVEDFQALAALLPPEWALPILRFPDQAPESPDALR